jgi:hypothetical protein
LRVSQRGTIRKGKTRRVGPGATSRLAPLQHPPERRLALAGFSDPANDLLGPADRFSVDAAGDLLLATTTGRFFSRVQLPTNPAHRNLAKTEISPKQRAEERKRQRKRRK